MSDAPPDRPWGFLIVVVVVAIAVSVVVGYLGITGQLGWGIPGTHSPSQSLAPLWPLLAA